MVFVLSIVAVFVAISIYFFLKAENLQRTIILMKRDISDTKKENKAFIEATTLIAKRHEEFYIQRLNQIKATALHDPATLKIITPLINNYLLIFNECLRGKGKLQQVTKKCYESYQEGSFKEFSNYIAKADIQIKRAWSSNNLSGFLMLVEALVIEQNKPAITSQVSGL